MKTFSILKAAGLLTLSVLALAPNTSSAKGGLDAGGGYAIQCDDGHLYSWDYINAPYESMAVNPEFLKAKSAKEILEKLALRLDKMNTTLAKSLRDYAKFNEDSLDLEQDRVWVKNSNPLLSLGDEDRVRIPKSCVRKANAKFKVIQAVIRKTKERAPRGTDPLDSMPTRKLYYADSKVLSRLAANPNKGALQLSSLYVHEWLRDFVSDANKITAINQFLHAAKWPETEGRFAEYLKQLDLYQFSGTLSGVYRYTTEDQQDTLRVRRNAFYADQMWISRPNESIFDAVAVQRTKGGEAIKVAGNLKALSLSISLSDIKERSWLSDETEDLDSEGRPRVYQSFSVPAQVVQAELQNYSGAETVLARQTVELHDVKDGQLTAETHPVDLEIVLALGDDMDNAADGRSCLRFQVYAQTVQQVPVEHNMRKHKESEPLFVGTPRVGVFCREKIGINK